MMITVNKCKNYDAMRKWERLRRWKDNTKTVPPCLQVLRRQMARIRRQYDALIKALYPTIKQIKNCVGGISGVGFYKEAKDEH